MAEIQQENVMSRYYPVKPIDPEEYSTKQYLYDMNTLLTQIERDLKILIELKVKKEEEQKQQRREQNKRRTIGIHD